MLDENTIERILAELPNKTVGLVGDLFLDRYLDIDANLTEPSLETGLDAYQVASVRSYPGAMGTVINNLAALGVGRIVPISFIGDDGEGYELLQALKALKVVELDAIFQTAERRTPTYCKPMLCESGKTPRELNRLDTKNRQPTPNGIVEKLVRALRGHFPRFDALIAVDQVSELDCGALGEEVRNALIGVAEQNPGKFIMADSRERIDLFGHCWIKPNELEVTRFQLGGNARNFTGIFETGGMHGIFVHLVNEGRTKQAPAYAVHGPIDIVGAGDSCSAAIASAMACGCDPFTAAQFGNLIASITIQQIGVTGTATPAMVRKRWQEVK